MTALAILRTALRRLQPCSHFHIPPPLRLSAFQSLPKLSQQSSRLIHTTLPPHAPDRPTVLTNMLASDVTPSVQVSSVGPAGIKLADGLLLTGPVIFLDGKVLLWDAPMHSWDEWTRAHWEVFDVVVPRPEILVLGTGARMELVPGSVRGYIKELGIQMDVMDTKNACSTYNLLAEEGRRVAAALLPIEPKQWR